MATAVPNYRRLPGSGTRHKGSMVAVSATRCSLWMSDDHLLCVDRQFSSEQYKRFYYRDIQAILIRLTNRTRNYNIVFASLILACILVGFLLGGGGLGFFIFLATAVAILMIVNTAKGPSCVCHLRTAVQTDELPSLGRLRNAEQAVALLRPMIEKAQGVLTPEDIQTVATQARQVSLAPAALSHEARQPEKLRHDDGRLHTVLFWLVIVSAISFIAGDFMGQAVFGIVASVLYCSNLLLSLICTIKQSRTDLSAEIKRNVWFVLIFLCVDAYLILLIASGIAGFKHAQQHRQEPMTQPGFADFMTVASSPVSAGISALVLFSCGAYGLYSLRKFREQYAQAQSQPPVEVVPDSTSSAVAPAVLQTADPGPASSVTTLPAAETGNTEPKKDGGPSLNA